MRGVHRLLTVLVSSALVGWTAGASFGADWDDERAARAFEMLDVDNNGSLTSAEYTAGIQSGKQSEANFDRIDTNESGTISPRELEQGWDVANNVLRTEIYKEDPIAQARVQESAFASLDTDDDDFLSANEYQAGIRVKSGQATWEFERIDDNRDGRLSRAEFNEDWGRFRKQLRSEVLYRNGEVDEPAAAARTEKKELAFVFLDTDNDGRLTLSEYRAGLKSRQGSRANFNAIDDNNDGELTRREFNEEWADVQARLRSDIYEESPALGIPRAERETELEDIFDEMDADNDGRLTIAEFQSGVPVSRTTAAKRFRAMDRDDDWFVTRSEFDSRWVRDKRKTSRYD